jgi:hypothetical protein
MGTELVGVGREHNEKKRMPVVVWPRNKGTQAERARELQPQRGIQKSDHSILYHNRADKLTGHSRPSPPLRL